VKLTELQFYMLCRLLKHTLFFFFLKNRALLLLLERAVLVTEALIPEENLLEVPVQAFPFDCGQCGK